MDKIKIERVSSRPNKFGSFVYIVHTPAEELPKDKEGNDPEGIVAGNDGDNLLFSRNRVGKLNVPFMCPVRVTAQVKDGTPTGRNFLNIVEVANETALDSLYATSQKMRDAESFGLEIEQSIVNGVVHEVIRKAAPKAVAATTPVTATPVKAAPKAEQKGGKQS